MNIYGQLYIFYFFLAPSATDLHGSILHTMIYGEETKKNITIMHNILVDSIKSKQLKGGTLLKYKYKQVQNLLLLTLMNAYSYALCVSMRTTKP